MVQLYQFYLWRKQEYPKIATDLPQVIDKRYRVNLARVVLELTTLVVICTDFIGSCNPNYHSITTTTVPSEL